MKKVFGLLKAMVFALVFLSVCSPVGAWFDETHLAVGKAAGSKAWYNLASADIVKAQLRSLGLPDKEGGNHFYNGSEFGKEEVLRQVEQCGKKGGDGLLLGAIVHKVREYQSAQAVGKYAEYHLAILGHYVGDLSMPLHVSAYNGFNRKYHKAFDGIVESVGFEQLAQRLVVQELVITSEEELINEVLVVAMRSRKLAENCRTNGRMLTEQEAIQQLSLSASLYKAILAYVNK